MGRDGPGSVPKDEAATKRDFWKKEQETERLSQKYIFQLSN
jgi:hypothetical protein